MPKFEIIRSAFLNAGYRTSGSHCNPKGLKTDAPLEFIWDVVRAWVRNEKLYLINFDLGCENGKRYHQIE